MKTKNATALALACIALFSACKKEKDINGTQLISGSSSYTQLKTGNYWVYEIYNIDDALGTITATGVYDSSYIEKDTLINGQVYFKKIENNYPYSATRAVYLRDSLDYLIDAHGEIRFSHLDFHTIFDFKVSMVSATDTILTITAHMSDFDEPFSVPAGTYITRNCVWEIEYMQAGYPYGPFRNINHRYAKGIGPVSIGLPYFVSDPVRQELRLVRYHVH